MNSITPGLLAATLWIISSGRDKLSFKNTFPAKTDMSFTQSVLNQSFLLLLRVLQFSIFWDEELAGG